MLRFEAGCPAHVTRCNWILNVRKVKDCLKDCNFLIALPVSQRCYTCIFVSNLLRNGIALQVTEKIASCYRAFTASFNLNNFDIEEFHTTVSSHVPLRIFSFKYIFYRTGLETRNKYSRFALHSKFDVNIQKKSHVYVYIYQPE